ncbi:hypothetical protein A9264_11690 [Vibrio sp. UCD-FRSSP16_10]|uniref:hypothetical protein n=2 Tax=unclassified Vibrio TaxID=2614977 RepID=UPI0007FE55B4|nr:hypothetical protein [Vibrio sp. UCD-FRSSP16_30]OBT16295.1 hypothetical protein A9260_11900 [Vibrio sp. UCD-FRSSP16_30]OBT21160.1 hypothetical protein A9264_11690 [Vibrio sp. UCD-FRSSP16_10]
MQGYEYWSERSAPWVFNEPANKRELEEVERFELAEHVRFTVKRGLSATLTVTSVGDGFYFEDDDGNYQSPDRIKLSLNAFDDDPATLIKDGCIGGDVHEAYVQLAITEREFAELERALIAGYREFSITLAIKAPHKLGNVYIPAEQRRRYVAGLEYLNCYHALELFKDSKTVSSAQGKGRYDHYLAEIFLMIKSNNTTFKLMLWVLLLLVVTSFEYFF